MGLPTSSLWYTEHVGTCLWASLPQSSKHQAQKPHLQPSHLSAKQFPKSSGIMKGTPQRFLGHFNVTISLIIWFLCLKSIAFLSLPLTISTSNSVFIVWILVSYSLTKFLVTISSFAFKNNAKSSGDAVATVWSGTVSEQIQHTTWQLWLWNCARLSRADWVLTWLVKQPAVCSISIKK